ncbi:MAG TPA: biotin transporter BioY [bacterium]|nr:biotin transporter BioY [bacterium]HPN42519.1 biotin transporter BioY [bacterium]
MLANKTVKIIYAGLFTALTAAGAFIKIPLPPVPVTLQTFFTILAGAILPPRYAFTCQAAYLLLGLAGLPVFALGGGLAYVLQPSFGYLLSLPLAAWLAAVLNRQFNLKKSLHFFLWINVLTAIVILVIGTFWLFISLECFSGAAISLQKVVFSGLLLFVPGELLKSVIASYIAVQYFKRIEKPGIL